MFPWGLLLLLSDGFDDLSFDTDEDIFLVPSVHLAVQAVLSLYASGRCSGLLMDVGLTETRAVPVCEGFVLPHALQRCHLGGNQLTDYLMKILEVWGRWLIMKMDILWYFWVVDISHTHKSSQIPYLHSVVFGGNHDSLGKRFLPRSAGDCWFVGQLWMANFRYVTLDYSIYFIVYLYIGVSSTEDASQTISVSKHRFHNLFRFFVWVRFSLSVSTGIVAPKAPNATCMCWNVCFSLIWI